MNTAYWKERKVLVTGATGFIGSHLAKQLAGLGADVHAWSASSDRLWRLDEAQQRIRLKTVDIRNLEEVRAACAEASPDTVFHLAAYGVNYDEHELGLAVDINVRGTVHLLEGLKATLCRRIVATGTWAEYGAKDHPMKEEETLEPVGVYGTSKATATTIALKMASQDKLPVVILRPFSVYGPGEGDYKFVPTVIRSCMKNESPRLTTCRQVRDYLFVDDVVEAYLKAAEAPIRMPAVMNIASGRPIALKELVSAVTSHFPGIEPAFGAIPDRENEIWRVEADVTRARELLGWQPAVSLEQGIEKTVAWFRNRYANS